MSNHLIIGLGGTGGKILREFRKRIYEEFRTVEPGHGLHLDYVYVDSSPADLNDRKDWKVMGKSVHLGESQKVNINGINASMLENINMYPGLQAFLNPEDIRMMREKMGPLISAGIGGQRRRLGRTLIANNLSDKNNTLNFESVVRGAVKRLQQDSGDSDVTFHICAGLAGGTGSGSIVDAVTQIRTWFPYNQDTKSFKMRLMVYMPEQTMVHTDHDAGFYQANGYAALTELNAMSVGSYKPVDVKGDRDIFSGQVQRLLQNQEPFEACYIYSNVNERGKVLELGHALPAVVADFLFQTVVASTLAGGQGKMARMEGCENEGAGPEVDQSGARTRSRKFLSFGITRVAYPESEVREFVTYSYATQAAKQLTYNYWLDGQGYSERTLDEVGSGYVEEIKSPKNRGSLMLDNSHLMLSEMIIENDSSKKWKELDNTWATRTAREVNDIMQTVADKKLWVNELSERCKNFFERDFRNQGVKTFYANQRKELKAYAKFIRRHIENKMFTDWATGNKSMLEIEKYIGILIGDCNERIGKFTTQKSNLANEALPKAMDEMKLQKIEYDNIGWLRDAITGASGKIFGRFQTAISDYYTTATRMESYDYAKELLGEIVLELSKMQEGVRAFKDRIAEINVEVEKQAASKCKTHEDEDESNIKKYDPEKVRMIVRQYTSNKEYQEQTAQSVRNALIANLGEDGERSFANLYDKTDFNSVSDTVLDICTDNAVSAMEETAKSDPLSRMVGVNILDKLKQELNTEDRMEQFVKQIVQNASTYVQFNAQEKSKVIAGNTGAMMSMVQVSIPAADESTQVFRNQLVDAFMKAVPGFTPQDVSTHYKPNEIVCVCVNAGFPLRYLANMVTLRDKYERLLAAPDGAFNRMVLHTESGMQFPALFEKDSRDIRKEIIKPLMLAYTLGLIQEQQNPTTGERFSAMKKKDVFGNDEWTPLGKTFATVWEALSNDYAKAVELQNLVQRTLQTEARSNEQKAALKPILGQVLANQVKGSLCEGNEFHPEFQKYKNLAIEILNNELKEA